MPSDLYLPSEVLADFRAHVTRELQQAEAGFASAQEEEDSLTGAMCERLRTRERFVDSPTGQPPGLWRWSINYAKLGSKGSKEAAESIIGADAVIEIQVYGIEGVQRKSALFQAKKEGTRDSGLEEQCAKMSMWREAAFVLNYTSNGYFAYSLDDCLRSNGSLERAGRGVPLANWLIDTFIGCIVGDKRLFYDQVSRSLVWARHARFGESEWSEPWVRVHFRPKHLVKVEVKAPDWRMHRASEISRASVPEHRLAFTARRLFGLEGSFTLAELRARRAKLVRTYHPDRHPNLPADAIRLLASRTTEINTAFERLKLETYSGVNSEPATAKTAASLPTKWICHGR